MLNQVVIVGRLVDNVNLLTEEDKEYAEICLAVPRPYENSDGIYETDFIKATIYGSIATNTSEYCHKGDLIGLKGSIKVENDKQFIMAEKITFLSAKKDKENGD